MGTLDRYRAPSATRLLSHLLENPALVSAVRELSPRALGKLIDSIGLESAGELVALATTSQLERVFDEDLWQEDAPGENPHFDPARFALWLEVLLEAGEAAVVARLVELPLDFVILAVQRLVLVVNVEQLGEELSEDKEALELMDKALDSSPCEEWEEFRLIARDPRGWDSVLLALLALDRDHHDVLRRILEHCAGASAEYIDDNGGLYAVLSSDEMLESDAGGERDDRRAAHGYVAASDAKSFLGLCRQGLGEDSERDPVTRAYFRELERGGALAAKQHVAPARSSSSELVRLLSEVSGVELEPTVDPSLGRPGAQSLLARALVELSATDPGVHAERLEELGYLANVLIAGERPERAKERRFRPIEALEEAAEVCNAALEQELAAAGERGAKQGVSVARAAKHLLTRHLDQLFRAGFRERRGAP